MKSFYDIKKIISSIGCLLLIASQPTFGQAEEDETDTNRAKKFPAVNHTLSESASQTALKILFIGGSLIYAGDVPGVLLGLIRAKDAQAAVKMSEVVGCNYTLKNHLENGSALKAINNQGPWDYVILQEQSSHLGNEVSKSVQETQPLAAHILRNHSRLIVFDTWTKLISPDYAIFSRCNEHFARSLGAERVPLLTALAQAKSIEGAKLFGWDGHHLASEGNYLSVCHVLQFTTLAE